MFSDKPKVHNKKLTTFYGNQIARPYVVLKEDGEVDKERVGLPKINDALIDWASKVPFKQGGNLVKPSNYEGAQCLKQARTDFQIFVTERYTDILAANPGLADTDDRRTLLAVASAFWRDRLSPEERKEFREKAQAEKLEAQGSLAEKEAADPKLKTYREKLRRYKRSVGGILSAAKAQAAPLWQVQRRANKQYRKLQEAEAAEAIDAEEEGSEEAEQVQPEAKKKAITKKASTKKRKQVEESEADNASDQEQEEKAAGRAAKGKKAVAAKPVGGASSSRLVSALQSKTGKVPKAAAASTKRGYQKVEDHEEEPQHEEAEKPSNKRQQRRQQASSNRADEAEGSGAAQLSKKLSKKKGKLANISLLCADLYAGEYDLPPSQHASPAKARPSKASKAKKGSLAGAERPQQNREEPKAAQGAGAQHGKQGSKLLKSPAKKLRSSSRLRV
ncbi:hypothetical protein N2152v2_002138 [Parachlorella kessleri]